MLPHAAYIVYQAYGEAEAEVCVIDGQRVCCEVVGDFNSLFIHVESTINGLWKLFASITNAKHPIKVNNLNALMKTIKCVMSSIL